jgi:hypothetical protein
MSLDSSDTAGPAAGFDPSQGWRLLVVATAGGLSGFDGADFLIGPSVLSLPGSPLGSVRLGGHPKGPVSPARFG